MGDVRLLLRLLRPEARAMAAGVLAGALTAAAVVGLMAVSGRLLALAVVVGAVTPHGWTPALSQLNAGIRFFAVTRTLGRYGERLLSHEATFRVLGRLREWFFARLAPLAPARLGAHRGGDLLERIVGDIDVLATFYVEMLAPAGVAMCVGVGALAPLSSFHPGLASAAAAPLVVAVVVLPAIAAFAGRRSGGERSEQARRLRLEWLDAAVGATEVVVFGAGARVARGLEGASGGLLGAQRRARRASSAVLAATRLVAGLGPWVVLAAGVALVDRGEVAAGHLTAVALAAMVVFDLVSPVAVAAFDAARVTRSARCLREIVEAEPPTPAPRQAAAAPASGDHTLRFERVTFGYRPGGPPVVRELSLEIPAGAKVAIAGATGSGKTTLASLAVRFWDPWSGRVTVGGVDLRDLAERDVRRLIGYVPQRPHLFSATVRDNLTIARPEATEDEIARAVEVAGLREVIEGQAEGLETWVGEGGVRLSGGQARRVALARALLRDTPILILDEPTEDLDPALAASVLDGVLRGAGGRTVVVITHRAVPPGAVDLVVTVEGGGATAAARAPRVSGGAGE